MAVTGSGHAAKPWLEFTGISKQAAAADFSQALLQIACLGCGSAASLAGYPGSDAVGGFVDLRQRGPAKISVNQCGREGVASAHRVSHFHLESRMFTALILGQQKTPVIPASDANQFETIRG